MTKFFPWPSKEAKIRQTKYRFEVLSLDKDERAYSDSAPGKKFFSKSFIVWDIKNHVQIHNAF